LVAAWRPQSRSFPRRPVLAEPHGTTVHWTRIPHPPVNFPRF
jgi:hypothetical protein